MVTWFEKHHQCSRWCKVHYFYNFDFEQHSPLPHTWNYLSSRYGWVAGHVHVGPPAWLPKRPDQDQWEAMRFTCPHHQIDLLCYTCSRHNFRPYAIGDA